MVLPLSVMSLVQNIKFQIASVATLFFVIIVWIYIFAHHGLEHTVPPIGNDQSTLIGFVLGNFAFVSLHPKAIACFAKYRGSSDHYDSFIHQRVITDSLDTQNYYLPHNCLCNLIHCHWLDWGFEFRNRRFIYSPRYLERLKWEQSTNHNYRHSVSSCGFGDISTSI